METWQEGCWMNPLQKMTASQTCLPCIQTWRNTLIKIKVKSNLRFWVIVSSCGTWCLAISCTLMSSSDNNNTCIMWSDILKHNVSDHTDSRKQQKVGFLQCNCVFEFYLLGESFREGPFSVVEGQNRKKCKNNPHKVAAVYRSTYQRVRFARNYAANTIFASYWKTDRDDVFLGFKMFHLPSPLGNDKWPAACILI